ncbi:hypothetical protein Plhal304r1_c011g0043951 [Plasmopara halstedii]
MPSLGIDNNTAAALPKPEDPHIVRVPESTMFGCISLFQDMTKEEKAPIDSKAVESIDLNFRPSGRSTKSFGSQEVDASCGSIHCNNSTKVNDETDTLNGKAFDDLLYK